MSENPDDVRDAYREALGGCRGILAAVTLSLMLIAAIAAIMVWALFYRHAG